ncbi:hypothetical protein JHK87_055748 [Glycine soja]|nr:hypothetical protein JHK87_055748 [Glycine soja]
MKSVFAFNPTFADRGLPILFNPRNGRSVVKATLVNFYETLRFELKDEVGITIATCGWIGSEMTWGKFMLEEDAEMQWKEERELNGYCGALIKYSSGTTIMHTHLDTCKKKSDITSKRQKSNSSSTTITPFLVVISHTILA